MQFCCNSTCRLRWSIKRRNTIPHDCLNCYADTRAPKLRIQCNKYIRSVTIAKHGTDYQKAYQVLSISAQITACSLEQQFSAWETVLFLGLGKITMLRFFNNYLDGVKSVSIFLFWEKNLLCCVQQARRRQIDHYFATRVQIHTVILVFTKADSFRCVFFYETTLNNKQLNDWYNNQWLNKKNDTSVKNTLKFHFFLCYLFNLTEK